ncbi:SRF-TF-domain-containing protein [Backusella circina FSU 941]|nr:SRF-TF-domain-containing protein [Backusella circina FSU 941]
MNDNVLPKPGTSFEEEDPNDSGDESESEKPARRSGRRKIKIEYIEDKNRRHITFSKRKAGIMKKAYELSTLTGTQVLLLVVSETGLVYTFTTVKLQPIVTKPEGKNLIQSCLNAPDPMSTEQQQITSGDASYNNTSSSPALDEKKPSFEDNKKIEPPQPTPTNSYGVPPNGTSYPPQPYGSQNNQMSVPPPPNNGYNHPGYSMGSTAPYQQSPQQQPQQPPQQQQQQQQQSAPYGQMGQPPFYGNQQSHYMSHQQPHPGYWQAPPNLQRPDDKTRRDMKK